MAKSLEDLQTPCLVLDLDRLKANATSISQKCQELSVKVRPNMAEHRCREIGEIATGGTKRCISVSSIGLAEFFAEGGFDDILSTSLFTADKIDRLKKLATTLQQFHLVVDSATSVALLDTNALDGKQWSVFLLVDCGHGYGGIPWDSPTLLDLAQKISTSPHLQLTGLYTRDADVEEIKEKLQAIPEMSPASKGQEIIREANAMTMDKLLKAAEKLQEAGLKPGILSAGSTPTVCFPSDKMKRLTEVHPENYALNDIRHANIGTCTVQDIALCVATRVVGHYPHKNQLLIDAGSQTLGLEAKDKLPNQHLIYVYNNPGLVLKTLTEEYGVIEPRKRNLDFSKYPVGSLLYLVPFHAQSTAGFHNRYYVQQAQIVNIWNAYSGHM